jgi:hypothetical protein
MLNYLFGRENQTKLYLNYLAEENPNQSFIGKNEKSLASDAQPHQIRNTILSFLECKGSDLEFCKSPFLFLKNL